MRRAIPIGLMLAGAAFAQVPPPTLPLVPPPSIAGRCTVAPLEAGIVPMVAVTIDGHGPYRFRIDSGARGHGRIRATLAEQLGLPVSAELTARGPKGPEPRRQFWIDALAIGDVTFGHVELGEMPAIGGRDPGFDGVLGLDLFQQIALTLDYGGHRIGIGTAPAGTAVPIDRSGRMPALGIAIGGAPRTVHLDIANSVAALMLPEADARALRLKGDPQVRGQVHDAFGSYDLKEAPIDLPVTLGGVPLPVSGVAWPAALPPGNLGSKAFAGLRLSIDTAAGKLWIAPSRGALRCP